MAFEKMLWGEEGKGGKGSRALDAQYLSAQYLVLKGEERGSEGADTTVVLK